MRGSLLTVATYSIGSLLFLCGCDKGDNYKPVDKSKNKVSDTLNAHDHDHGHDHGPHDGHIIELGNEEYHGELVYDAKTKTVGVYFFGPDLKKPQPIDAKTVNLNLSLEGKPLQVTLNAKPLDSEKDGKASYYELIGNAELAEHAKDLEDLSGKLQVQISGKQYSGEIAHEDDHGHDHDHADEKDGRAQGRRPQAGRRQGRSAPPAK